VVEGDNLRVTQLPDPDTGELAFGVAAVFEVPRNGSGTLRVADFPPVAIHWSDSGEDEPGEAAG
jgi:hypothetical protein